MAIIFQLGNSRGNFSWLFVRAHNLSASDQMLAKLLICHCFGLQIGLFNSFSFWKEK